MRRTVLAIGVIVTLATHAAAQVGTPPPPPRPPAPPIGNVKLATGTATIAGRVIAETGRPVRRAQVRVTAPELGGRGRTASTDVGGRYRIADLPAGQYTISVTSGGHLPTEYGQRRFGESGTPLAVGEGEAHATIDFTLRRAATITGRVVDESGLPLAGAVLYAMQPRFVQGRRQMVPLAGGAGIETDDTGQFRLHGVPPGVFYVLATSAEVWADDEDPDVIFGFSPTYYPGTPVAADAQPLTVGVGQAIASIEFSLVPARSATLSGTALGQDGAPIPGASVTLSPPARGPFTGRLDTTASTRVNADGSWRLDRILPGEYLLRLTGPGREGRSDGAAMPVTVSGDNLAGLVLAADPGTLLTGEVVADPGLTRPPGALRVHVAALHSGGATPHAGDGLVRDDGRFSRRAPSGQVLVTVSPLPPGWAIRAVELDGANYAGRPLELRRGAHVEGVTITLTNRFPALTGALRDDRGPTVDATVVLFPQDDSLWIEGTGAVRAERPDGSGQYQLAAVRPGEYLAIAVRSVQPWQVHDPDFLAALRADATRIALREGQTHTLDLRVKR
jgi:hypothetical protein